MLNIRYRVQLLASFFLISSASVLSAPTQPQTITQETLSQFSPPPTEATTLIPLHIWYHTGESRREIEELLSKNSGNPITFEDTESQSYYTFITLKSVMEQLRQQGASVLDPRVYQIIDYLNKYFKLRGTYIYTSQQDINDIESILYEFSSLPGFGIDMLLREATAEENTLMESFIFIQHQMLIHPRLDRVFTRQKDLLQELVSAIQLKLKSGSTSDFNNYNKLVSFIVGTYADVGRIGGSPFLLSPAFYYVNLKEQGRRSDIRSIIKIVKKSEPGADKQYRKALDMLSNWRGHGYLVRRKNGGWNNFIDKMASELMASASESSLFPEIQNYFERYLRKHYYSERDAACSVDGIFDGLCKNLSTTTSSGQ